MRTPAHATDKKAVDSPILKNPACPSARLVPVRMNLNASTDTLEVFVQAGEPPEHAEMEIDVVKDTP